MEFARLEYLSEMSYVFDAITAFSAGDIYFHVDGVSTVPGSRTGWYWARIERDFPLTMQ